THSPVALTANVSSVYTPASNFNGSDSFTYSARDNSGLDSNLATVLITISPVNDAPVANNDAYTTTEDSTLAVGTSLRVLVNDTDVDLDPLTAILGQGPA